MIDRKKEKKERKKERQNPLKVKICLVINNVTVEESQVMVKALDDFRAKGGKY